MAEPTTSTVATISGSAFIASLMPFVDGDAIFGAIVGAACVAYYSNESSYARRISAFLLSCALGYLLAPQFLKYNLFFIESLAAAAFAVSAFAILILDKVFIWLRNASLSDIASKAIDFLSTFKKPKKGGD
ncbi:putative holin [Acinetobacter sp. A47]|uniref:putative holin n=1 Tax=Acinetobacter sp. A47 TaxID=1561217 RepID=UPI00068E7CEF|nr:putative holin [Acinetobacter sp. A47]